MTGPGPVFEPSAKARRRPAPVPPASGLCAVVVIPARDEEHRIEACLQALCAQHEVAADAYELIVVLDGCRDRTGEVVERVARRCRGIAIETVVLPQPRGVGRARRTGMDLACERLLAAGRNDGLIASTDADTVVAPDWLAAQLALVASGAEAIGGLIELEDTLPAALDPAALAAREHSVRRRLAAIREDHSEEAEHPHFSGASLSLTAAAYRRCGGLPASAALEDEALARALERHGVPIVRTSRVRARTSARTDGRAPRGLAQDLRRADWRARHSHRAEEFPLERLLEAKTATVSLILPAREVASTVGPIARVAAGLRDAGLIEEILLVDAASRDGTAAVARAAGIEVAQESELLPEYGPCLGKGDAMWRGLAATEGEIVAFADTDTADFHEGFLLGLLGPLLCDPAVQLVKGTFQRPFREGDVVLAGGGGRVTELMARPLLNLHAAELAVFEQPLAGETAGRRELLEEIPFSAGYGVEIATLIDCWRRCGLDALAQVDLGQRQNRHQPLRELSAMAYAVLVAAQARFLGAEFADAHAAASMVLPPLEGTGGVLESRAVTVEERPPLSAHRRAAARAA